MTTPRRRLISALVLAPLLALLGQAGYRRIEGAPTAGEAALVPRTLSEVEPLRRGGASWSNRQVRGHYLALVAAIGERDRQLVAAGRSAEARAHLAFAARHGARALARAMMSDAAEVAALRQRDQQKYGHPDGPRFEELVEKERRRGRQGDEIFAAIVASAQRTEGTVNRLLGLGDPAP